MIKNPKVGMLVKFIRLGCRGDNDYRCCNDNGYNLKDVYKIKEISHDSIILEKKHKHRQNNCTFDKHFLIQVKINIKDILGTN